MQISASSRYFWYHFAPSIVRFSVGEEVQGRLLEDTSSALFDAITGEIRIEGAYRLPSGACAKSTPKSQILALIAVQIWAPGPIR